MRTSIALFFSLLFSSTALAINTISIPDLSADIGEQGVEVLVNFANDDSIGGYQLDLKFENTVMSLSSVEAVNRSAHGTFVSSSPFVDQERIIWFGLDGNALVPILPGDEEVLRFTFNVLSNATPGDYALHLLAVVLSDVNGNEIEAEVQDGVITIVDPDSDQDGFTTEDGDCDDEDATSYPGATEIPYDGIDQNCDGQDLTDVDLDTFDSDLVEGGTDCNDDDASIYLGAVEIPDDGIDQDCDGEDLVSEDTGPVDTGGDTDSTDTGGNGEPEGTPKEGCAGCSATPSQLSLGWAVGLLGLVSLRRRR